MFVHGAIFNGLITGVIYTYSGNMFIACQMFVLAMAVYHNMHSLKTLDYEFRTKASEAFAQTKRKPNKNTDMAFH